MDFIMKNIWLEIVASISGLKRTQSFASLVMQASLITIISFLFGATVSARIPEPDHIIYGTLTYNNSLATSADSQLTVRFELFGNELVSYQMGSEAIGNNFVLRIPIDVLEPRAPLTAWLGETGQIYITKTGVNILAGAVVVGERGTLQALNISGFNDTDLDGLPDEWELDNGLNPSDSNDAILDGDSDGLTNLEEFQYGTDAQVSDTDGDGINDGDEVIAGTDPTDAQSLPVMIVSTPVNDGVVDELYSYTLQANQPNVEYELLVAPAGASIIDVMGVKSLQWTPTSADVGGHTITVEATVNSVPSDTQTYLLNIVTNANAGDINGDGVVNVVDILLAQQIILNQLTPDAGQLQRGDVAPLVNGVPAPDGQFNAGDLLMIQRKALGLINY